MAADLDWAANSNASKQETRRGATNEHAEGVTSRQPSHFMARDPEEREAFQPSHCSLPPPLLTAAPAARYNSSSDTSNDGSEQVVELPVQLQAMSDHEFDAFHGWCKSHRQPLDVDAICRWQNSPEYDACISELDSRAGELDGAALRSIWPTLEPEQAPIMVPTMTVRALFAGMLEGTIGFLASPFRSRPPSEPPPPPSASPPPLRSQFSEPDGLQSFRSQQALWFSAHGSSAELLAPRREPKTLFGRLKGRLPGFRRNRGQARLGPLAQCRVQDDESLLNPDALLPRHIRAPVVPRPGVPKPGPRPHRDVRPA